MNVIFRQRLTHGLQMNTSYTWSHTLDVTTDSNGGGTPLIPYDWKDDYGNSNWDIRHRFIASFVYDIPFFGVTNPVLKGMFTKWQANGIITIQTGLPFNVSTGTDTANTASSGTYRPNLVGTPSEDCGRGNLVGCITASAFTVNNLYPIAPTNYAYGNAGRNLLHGPGLENVNFSLFKNFPLRERLKLQFRHGDLRAVQPFELRESGRGPEHVVVRQHHDLKHDGAGKPRHPVRPEAVFLEAGNNFEDFVDRALGVERTRQRFTKRTQGLLPMRETTKRTQEVLVGNAARKYETNPRPRTSQRLEERFDICTIFVRAMATGGMRTGDVIGNIGEISAGGM